MRSHIFKLAAAAAMVSACVPALAHISYTGRDFGTLVDGSTVTIATQKVTSNYGWADASDQSLVFDSTLASTARQDEAAFVSGTGTDDLYLGDSHKGKAFKLHLDTKLSVTLSASSINSNGLTAAFSVYQGLVSPAGGLQTSPDHDFAAASQAWRSSFAQGVAGASYNYLATNGSWNALGNWAIGGDGDPAGDDSAIDFLKFVGYGATTFANGTATTTLTLGPGDYTVFVGGNSIADKSLLNSTKSYAFSLGVTAAAVPEPETYALLLAGLGIVAMVRRRQQAR